MSQDRIDPIYCADTKALQGKEIKHHCRETKLIVTVHMKSCSVPSQDDQQVNHVNRSGI